MSGPLAPAPVGHIARFPGDPPPGWIRCAGQPVLEYPELIPVVAATERGDGGRELLVRVGYRTTSIGKLIPVNPKLIIRVSSARPTS